jgi:hypothetical protein
MWDRQNILTQRFLYNFSGMGYAPAFGWAIVRLLPIQPAEDGLDISVVEQAPETSLV